MLTHAVSFGARSAVTPVLLLHIWLLGMTLMDIRNYSEAARVLRQAVKRALPDDKETMGAAKSNLALVHFYLGRTREFIKAFQQAQRVWRRISRTM